MAYNMYLHRLCVVEYCILYTESLKSALQMVLLCATSYMLDLSRMPYYLPNVVYRMSSARVATSRLGQCANRAPEYDCMKQPAPVIPIMEILHSYRVSPTLRDVRLHASL